MKKILERNIPHACPKCNYDISYYKKEGYIMCETNPKCPNYNKKIIVVKEES